MKKEDVTLLKGKSQKEKLPTSNFVKFGIQLTRYRKFAEDSKNAAIIEQRLGFTPGMFSYVLLAGRADEKDRYKNEIREIMVDHFPGLKLISYEELEELAIHYLERYWRMAI